MKLLPLLASAVVILSANRSQAAVLLSDDFTGTAGTGVNGRPVQYYDAGYYSNAPIWNASPRVLLSGSNAATINEAGTSGGATAIISPSAANGSISVEATIVTQGANYVALSLLGNGSTNVFDVANPFLMTLWNTGAITLYKNGGTNVFQAGIGGFSASTAYTVALQYSFETNLASIYLNNSLFTSLTVTGLNSSAVTGAGFYFLSGQTTTTLDNFRVSVVPEPATGLLSALALAFIGISSRRRSRIKDKIEYTTQSAR